MRVDELKGGNPQNPILSPKSVTELTIHDVHILDSSSSMRGSKYTSAVEGINGDIDVSNQQAKEHPEITNTITIVEFSGTGSRKVHAFMVPIDQAPKLNIKLIGNNTALYETIGWTIKQLLEKKKKEDKVLLKIFTDGAENSSQGEFKPLSYAGASPALANLIKKVQEEDNFIVTFVGTKHDTNNMIKKLNIDASNTLVHANTAESIRMSYEKTSKARGAFMMSALAGEDVSTGFYSKTLN